MIDQNVIRLLKKTRDLNKFKFSKEDIKNAGISEHTIQNAKELKIITGGPKNFKVTKEGFFTLTQHEQNEYAKAIQENLIKLNSVINKLNISTDRYSREMIKYTKILAILTIMLLLFAVIHAIPIIKQIL